MRGSAGHDHARQSCLRDNRIPNMQEGGDLGRRLPASGRDFEPPPSAQKLPASTIFPIDVGPSVRKRPPDYALRNPRALSTRWRYGTTRRSPPTGVPAQTCFVSETRCYRYVPTICRKPLPCGRPEHFAWAAAGSGPGFAARQLIAFPGCSRFTFRAKMRQVQRQNGVVPGVPDVHRQSKKVLRL